MGDIDVVSMEVTDYSAGTFLCTLTSVGINFHRLHKEMSLMKSELHQPIGIEI